ncbi:phage tail tape measure protein [Glycomyces sp. NPDC021274]|uniref:phage tail tape measure protein n=1 Tax=Glycomyces sp. NPDC021274 TaxID=3155120 RepID=UPI003410F5F6
MRTISVKYVANIKEYTANVGEMVKTTRDFRKELSETAAKGKGDLDAVANGAIAFGLALGGALAAGVAQAAQFDHAMAQVNAVSNATAAEFGALRQAAIDMGASTQFSATEAANAIEELSKAGLTAAQITGGALAGALNLAAAGGIGLAEAASIAATTLKQFNLEASQMSSVADTLAGSANASNTDVTGLGQSLKNVGTVAAQAGLSVEETVGILSAMGDQALTGAEAGTNLKTTLLRLLAPTKEAKAVMDDLGISIYDTNGNVLGAVDIVRELEDGLAQLSIEERNAAMAVLFGQEAIAGANILLAEGAAGISTYIDKVSEQGVAAETAAKRINSLQGDVGQLTSAIEGLAIESSGGLSEALRTIVQFATGLIGTLQAIPAPITNTVVIIGVLVAGAALLGGAFLRVRDRAAQMNAQLAATGPAGAKAAGALSSVGRYAGPAAMALGVVQVASMALAAAFGKQLNPQIEAFGTGLERWARDGEIAGEAARIMGDDFDKFSQSLESAADEGFTRGLAAFTEGMVSGAKEIDDSLAKSTERISAMDAALAQLYASDPEAAAEAWSKISDEADKQGISMERLNEIFPEYQAALENSTAKTEEAAEAVNPYTLQLEFLAEQMGVTGETAEQAVTDMLQVWSDGATAFVDLLGAYNAGLDGLEENAKLTSEGFIEELRQQAEAQAQWAENMTILAERGVGGMINELAAMGPEGAEMVALMAQMTDEELQEVVRLWGLRGDQTGQEIAAGIIAGIDDSEDGIDGLQNAIDGLHGTTVDIVLQTINQAAQHEFGPNALQAQRWGGVTVHAQRGLLNAGIYSAQNPARYAFAEPATGGEAFIPRRGNRARSLAILDVAASWYGADITRRGQWRGQRPVEVATITSMTGASGSGRPYGSTVVEHQEVNVHAHTDDFKYAQVMDEMSWHGAF